MTKGPQSTVGDMDQSFHNLGRWAVMLHAVTQRPQCLFLFHHHLGALTLSTESKLHHRHVHTLANGKEKRGGKNPRQEIFSYAREAHLTLITSVHTLMASIQSQESQGHTWPKRRLGNVVSSRGAMCPGRENSRSQSMQFCCHYLKVAYGEERCFPHINPKISFKLDMIFLL